MSGVVVGLRRHGPAPGHGVLAGGRGRWRSRHRWVSGTSARPRRVARGHLQQAGRPEKDRASALGRDADRRVRAVGRSEHGSRHLSAAVKSPGAEQTSDPPGSPAAQGDADVCVCGSVNGFSITDLSIRGSPRRESAAPHVGGDRVDAIVLRISYPTSRAFTWATIRCRASVAVLSEGRLGCDGCSPCRPDARHVQRRGLPKDGLALEKLLANRSPSPLGVLAAVSGRRAARCGRGHQLTRLGRLRSGSRPVAQAQLAGARLVSGVSW